MATLVLVHGAWHGGWCWQRTTPLLRAMGHKVWTPTLTGLGERLHLARPEIDLSLHTRDLLNVLTFEDLWDVVLVGHSYGATIAALTADRAPERVRRLVYLDAAPNPAGTSYWEGMTPERRAFWETAIARLGSGWQAPPPELERLGVSDDDADWLVRYLTPQPTGTWHERATYLHPAGPPVPATLIACVAPLTAGRPRAKRDTNPDWGYAELAAGHDAMVTAPRALADLLDRIAR